MDTEQDNGLERRAGCADFYKVVINDEGQYSIWPADRDNPAGWYAEGKTGAKVECLDYIKGIWTDMRPLSLRKKMQEMGLD